MSGSNVIPGLAVVVSVLALGGSIFSTAMTLTTTLVTAGSAQMTANSRACFEWARYVMDEQDSDRWGDLTAEQIDARIDRVGEVFFENLRATEASAMAATSTPAASPSPSVGTSATSSDGFAPYPDYCGSAAMYRNARTTDDPLIPAP